MKIVTVVLLIAISMAGGAAIHAQFVSPEEPVVEADSPTLTKGEAIAVVKTWLANRMVPGQNFDCLTYWTQFAEVNHWEALYGDDGSWAVGAANQDGGTWGVWALYESTLSVDQFETSSPFC